MISGIRSLTAALLIYCGGLLLFPYSAAAEENYEAKALSSVVRLEIITDQFSFAPSLLQQISLSPHSPPFEVELARRLRQGASGSAFCVSPGWFITTAHIVLAGARFDRLAFSPEQWASLEASLLAFSKPQITLYLADPPTQLAGQVIALDRADDLALLYFPAAAGQIPALDLGDVSALEVASSITALGYQENGLQISRGKVESLIRGKTALEAGIIKSQPGSGKTPIIVGKSDGEVVRFQHSAAVASGMSGGPILDGSGRVVGVSYGVLSAPGSGTEASAKIYLAVSSQAIKRFLDANQDRRSLAKPSPEAKLEGTGFPNSLSAFPPPQSPAQSQELEALAFDIRHHRAAAALPRLEVRLRRNRFDYSTRALLIQAHYQESLYPAQTGPQLQAAYYQAAWLAYFAPEIDFALPAEKFLSEQRDRVEPYLSAPGAKSVFLVGLGQNILLSAVRQGRVGQLLPKQFLDLTPQALRLQGRASRRDGVAVAALIQLYLAQEQAWELADPFGLKEDSRSARRQLLSQALALAIPLSEQLPLAPGAGRLAGYIFARQSRLENPASPPSRAGVEYEKAFRLDPTSPGISAALAQLGRKP
jgi:S1-C subfamily serine protease